MRGSSCSVISGIGLRLVRFARVATSGWVYLVEYPRANIWINCQKNYLDCVPHLGRA